MTKPALVRNYNLNYELKVLKYIISLCLYMYLIVDTIAGFLVSRHLPNIGQLYKILLVFLMLIYIAATNKNFVLIISFLFAWMFIIPLNFIFSEFANFSQSIMIIFKTISVFIFYEYFQEDINSEELDKIFKINYIVFILNILAGVLGFAKGTYSYGEESVGTTGFFYAGNEVTFTFICLSFWFITRGNMKKNLKYILSILLSVMIGTKSGMLGILLLIFFDVYFSAKPKNRVKIVIRSLLIVSLIIFIVYNFLQQNPLYQYIAFKIKQHLGRGKFPILNALLSGRLERLPIITEIYENNFSFSTFLLGLGFPNPVKRIEMDFFEYYYYFGFIAFFFLFLFYLNILYLSYKKNNKRQFWFNVVCIIISFLAGHIVYSVMGGLFFAMINSPSYSETICYKPKKRKISRINHIIFSFHS